MPLCLDSQYTVRNGAYYFVSPRLQVACYVVEMPLPLCSDYNNIKAAYEAMKNVACLINERKRKLESIDKIARWQVSIVGWEVSGGPAPRRAVQRRPRPPPFGLFDEYFNALGWYFILSALVVCVYLEAGH